MPRPFDHLPSHLSGAALAAGCAAAELGRRQAQFVAKAILDVSDIGEARMLGNICDRMFCLEQQPLGPLDPDASYFSSQRDADRIAYTAFQPAAADRNLLQHVRNIDGTVAVLADEANGGDDIWFVDREYIRGAAGGDANRGKQDLRRLDSALVTLAQ